MQGQLNYTPIWGIAENSTSSAPYPDGSAFATQYSGQSNCNGAIDSSCNSANILAYYNNIISGAPVNLSYYAAGLCNQSTAGSATAGMWYLPSACELNGSIYLDAVTNNFSSCSPVLTGVFSLYSLGTLGGILQGLIPSGYYWSSTEYSLGARTAAWHQYFAPGGGGNQAWAIAKSSPLGVRCGRALSL